MNDDSNNSGKSYAQILLELNRKMQREYRSDMIEMERRNSVFAYVCAYTVLVVVIVGFAILFIYA